MTKPALIRQVEIARAVREARKAGATKVRIEKNGMAVELELGEGHIAGMSGGHHPSPEASEGERKPKVFW